MDSKIIIMAAIAIAISETAFATGRPLQECSARLCSQVHCITIPSDQIFKVWFDPSKNGKSGFVFTYRGFIGPDNEAISKIPFTVPVMFCGSHYPPGKGRVIR